VKCFLSEAILFFFVLNYLKSLGNSLVKNFTNDVTSLVFSEESERKYEES